MIRQSSLLALPLAGLIILGAKIAIAQSTSEPPKPPVESGQPLGKLDQEQREKFVHALKRALELSSSARPFNPRCDIGDLACAGWAKFRRSRPYPHQTVAVARLAEDRLAIIVSEPPSLLSKQELDLLADKLFGDDLIDQSYRRWMIGIDGWVEDLVLTVKAPPNTQPLDDRLLQDRIAFLWEALFGSALAIEVESIDTDSSSTSGASDLTIRSIDVQSWLNDDALTWKTFTSSGWENRTSWRQANPAAGEFVHLSNDGTLVLFTVTMDQLLAAEKEPTPLLPAREAFRIFAVASDVVFGGTWTQSGLVAILARGRSVAQKVMAPLRFETLQILASDTTDELAQSYERTRMFAGKLSSGPKALADWAPIYLSAPLINGEFGALLNITDQMLKSWSEAGKVQYVYFDYPRKPAKFVLPAERISYRLREEFGGSSVLFNWNTAGQAAITRRHEGLSVMTLSHTSALPVTYRAGQDQESYSVVSQEREARYAEYENTAYTYFAGLEDANLARAAQYTLIYQLFREAKRDLDPGSSRSSKIGMDSSQESEARVKANRVLTEEAKDLLTRIEHGSLTPIGLRDLPEERRNDKGAVAYRENFEREVAKAKRQIKDIRQLQPNWSIDDLAVALANPQVEIKKMTSQSELVRKLASERKSDLNAHEAMIDSYNAQVKEEKEETLAWVKQNLSNLRLRYKTEEELKAAIFHILSQRSKVAQERLKAERAKIDAREKYLEIKYRPIEELVSRIRALKRVNQLRSNLRDLASVSVDTDRIRQKFINANAAQPVGRIKTPSVVLSWDGGNLQSVGGHNLSARSLRFERAPIASQIEIVEGPNGPILRYDPKIAGRIEGNENLIARLVEHGKLKDAKVLIEAVPVVTPPLKRLTALKIDPTKETTAKKLVALIGGRPLRGQVSLAKSVAHVESMVKQANCCTFVVRAKSGEQVIATRKLNPPPTVQVKIARGPEKIAVNLNAATKTPSGQPVVFLNHRQGYATGVMRNVRQFQDGKNGILRKLSDVFGNRPAVANDNVARISHIDVAGREVVLDVANPGSAWNLARTLNQKVTSNGLPKFVTLSKQEVLSLLKDSGARVVPSDGVPVGIRLNFGNVDGPVSFVATPKTPKTPGAEVMKRLRNSIADAVSGARQSKRNATHLDILAAVKINLQDVVNQNFIGRFLAVVKTKKQLERISHNGKTALPIPSNG